MVVKNEGSHQRNYRIAQKGTKRVYEFYKIILKIFLLFRVQWICSLLVKLIL